MRKQPSMRRDSTTSGSRTLSSWKKIPEAIEKALQARGFTTKRRGHIGLVNAIGIDPHTGERLGAADPRDNGAAIGY